MDEKQKEEVEALTKEEASAKTEGQELYEMTQTKGWKVIAEWLKDMAFHRWSDPRETSSEKEWMWRELNTFHAADTAQGLLGKVAESINESERLQQKELGQLKEKRMKL